MPKDKKQPKKEEVKAEDYADYGDYVRAKKEAEAKK